MKHPKCVITEAPMKVRLGPIRYALGGVVGQGQQAGKTFSISQSPY